jgi:hypothetical protein
MGTILSYIDDTERPRAEVVLASGDLIVVALDAGGLTVSHAGDERAQILFQAAPDTVARLCAAFVERSDPAPPTPLKIIVAAIVQIASADLVERAFGDAASRLS